MKAIDFSQLGGYPFCQDDLAYLQEAWTEALVALASVGGSGPLIISGCAITKTLVSGTTYNYTITAGWVLYNGAMIRVLAGGFSGIDESVNALYMQITNNATADPLAFENGSTPPVILESTIGLMAQVIGTANDATHILVSGLQPYGREASETSIVVSTASGFGTISGNIYYRKNFMNNTLQLRGLLTTATPQDFPALPGLSTQVMATLPVGYRPSTYFASFTAPVGNLATDASGAYFDSLQCYLNTSGQLVIGWRKMGATPWGCWFNVIVPLD